MPVDISQILGALGQLRDANKTEADRIMSAQQARGGTYGALLGIGGGIGGGIFGGPLGAAAGAGLGTVLGHSLAGGGAGMRGTDTQALQAATTGYQIGQQAQQQQAQGALSPLLSQGIKTQQDAARAATAASGVEGTSPVEDRLGALANMTSPAALAKMAPQQVAELMRLATPQIIQTAPGTTTSAVSPLGLMTDTGQNAGGSQVIKEGERPRLLTDAQVDDLNTRGFRLDKQKQWMVMPGGGFKEVGTAPPAADRDLLEYNRYEKRIAGGDTLSADEEARYNELGSRLAAGETIKDPVTGAVTSLRPPQDLSVIRAGYRKRLATDVKLPGDLPLPRAAAPQGTGSVPVYPSVEEDAEFSQMSRTRDMVKQMQQDFPIASAWGKANKLSEAGVWLNKVTGGLSPDPPPEAVRYINAHNMLKTQTAAGAGIGRRISNFEMKTFVEQIPEIGDPTKRGMSQLAGFDKLLSERQQDALDYATQRKQVLSPRMQAFQAEKAAASSAGLPAGVAHSDLAAAPKMTRAEYKALKAQGKAPKIVQYTD